MSVTNSRVAIISGGATLIGLKIAEAFVKSGVRVAIADINESDGEDMCASLGELSMFVRTDITIDQEIEHCVDTIISKWNRIDYLVNVACTYLDGGFESSREDWLKSLNTNVVSSAIFAEKVVPHLKVQSRGSIVNFASIGAKVAQPSRMLYSVSKAAILGMTRNQALALAGTGIRVNSVSPGWTWSNVIRDFSGNDRKHADSVAAPFHLNGRLVDAEEVAAVVVFLCSEQASGINGTDVAVDGGYSAIGPEQKSDKIAQLNKGNPDS